MINVSSGYGALDGVSSEATAYCLSKLALNGATIILAKALATDANVNHRYPYTDGWTAALRSSSGAPARNTLRKPCLSGRPIASGQARSTISS